MTQVANALRSTALTALTGGSDVVFAESAYGSLQERFVFNPNASGSIWINPFGGVAAANTSGCIELPPGTGWSAKSTSAINAYGAVGAKITAGEL